MRVAEFFAGSRSIGRKALELGMEVWSTDIVPFDSIDCVKNILEITRDDIPFIPDVLWFSPDCTTYSIAACSTHRKYVKGVPTPVTSKAYLADVVLDAIHEIISWYPNAVYFIENPRGLMRKMPSMLFIPHFTVTYCQYGDSRMKPTDIWTNSQTWIPRKACKNGGKCHISAPRGARTGTQGLKGSYERSRIPEQLCEEILKSTIKARSND